MTDLGKKKTAVFFLWLFKKTSLYRFRKKNQWLFLRWSWLICKFRKQDWNKSKSAFSKIKYFKLNKRVIYYQGQLILLFKPKDKWPNVPQRKVSLTLWVHMADILIETKLTAKTENHSSLLHRIRVREGRYAFIPHCTISYRASRAFFPISFFKGFWHFRMP